VRKLLKLYGSPEVGKTLQLTFKKPVANGIDVGRVAEVDGAFKVLAVPAEPFAVVGLGVAAGQ
jgi:hypothetical protein